MMTLVAGLLVFSVLVIVHEAGHFLVARWMGVRVERFSVGFGPVVFSRVVRGVQYAVSAFPLGGYVKMGGDDPRDRENLRPDDFFAAAWWRRVLIAFAGPGANFLLAVALGILLAWIGFRSPDAASVVGKLDPQSLAAEAGFAPGDVVTAINGNPVESSSQVWTALLGKDAPGEAVFRLDRDGARLDITVPAERYEELLRGLAFFTPATVGQVGIGTPAYKSGIQVGDRIVAIDDEEVESWSDMTRHIRANPGEEIVLTVNRDGRVIRFPVVPMVQEGDDGETYGQLGIVMAGEKTYVQRYGFWEGMRIGTEVAVTTVRLTLDAFGKLVTNFRSNVNQISGPAGIIEASGVAARAGVDALINFAIFISVALMVFNLLPIPILDGGMVIMSVLEGVRRRPLGNTGLAVYQGIGMAVIGTLLIFVLVNDSLRIWERHTAKDRVTEVAP